jgi:hypothetical protein
MVYDAVPSTRVKLSLVIARTINLSEDHVLSMWFNARRALFISHAGGT